MTNSLIQTADTGRRLSDSWLILGSGAIVSGMLILWSPDDLGTKVSAMLLFWLVSIISIRMDITHPFFWFGGPFLLYSISGALLFTIGMHPLVTWGGFPVAELDYGFAMDMQYTGLMASFLVIGPRRMNLSAVLGDYRTQRFFNGLLPVLALTMLLAGFAVSEIIAQGFTQKRELVRYGSWGTQFTFGLHMMATCAGVFLVKQFIENKPLRAYVAMAGFISIGVLIVLFAGERNFLFRVLIVIFFAYHISYHKISNWSFLALFLITSPLILILGQFKMGGVAGAATGASISSLQDIIDLAGFLEMTAVQNEPSFILYGKYLLFLILSDEFRAGGDNFAMLVTRMPMEIPFQNGFTLMTDLASSVIPGFLRIKPATSAYIYSSALFPLTKAAGGGQGFTLIGSGYLNFGIAGAITIMAGFGAVVRMIYRWAARSIFGLFFFLGFVPIVFSVARNGLNTPISQGLKHVLLPLAIMLVISYLTGRDGRSGAAETPPTMNR